MNRSKIFNFLMLLALATPALGKREAPKTVKMVLISNQENTRFQYRPYGTTEWLQAGPGKIETIDVQPSQRYELKAKAPGYIEKSSTIPEPFREVQFVFMRGDQCVQLLSNIENTQFRMRGPGEQTWRTVGVGTNVEVRAYHDECYEVAAKLPGYREKTNSLMQGTFVLPFTFPSKPDEPPPQTNVVMASGIATNTPPPPPPIQHSWAVVIGISEYQFADQGGLTRLSYADNDAKGFTSALATMGWKPDKIKVLTNEQATKRNIEYALETWLRHAGKDDLIVLYWSGHGWPDVENQERAHFACYDSKPSDPSSSLRMDRVRLLLEERGARNVILIADTCHSGKIVRAGDPKGISVRPALEAMNRNSDIPKGWVFVASADPTRKAYEDKAWSNGALTHVLLQGLRGAADGYKSAGNKDGRITLGELKEYIKERMAEEGLNVVGARLEPLFYATSGNPEIWNLSLSGQ